MKKYYSLIIFVLDECGNRIDAHKITGGNNKKDILKKRTQLKKEIKNGKYAHLSRGDYLLYAGIEVQELEMYRDDDEPLEII